MNRKTKRTSPGSSLELSADQLRWTCDPSAFDFESTDEIGECPITIIGQPRAVDALKLGLAIWADGYNIFVAGEVGTGRSTTVRTQLAAIERCGAAPDDLCYVHNFRDRDQPSLLVFPNGQGCNFAKAMEVLVDGLRTNLPELFDSEGYRRRRTATVQAVKAKHKERLKGFEKEVGEEGFTLESEGAKIELPYEGVRSAKLDPDL